MSSICASAKALDFKAYKRFYLLMSFRLSVLNIVRVSAIISCMSGFTLTANASSEEVSLGSTSLCGDAYLLAMAPDRISELSWQSRSPLSGANPAQKSLPQLWDSPETLVSSRSDMILFGPGEGAIANKIGIGSAQLKWGEDFQAVTNNAKMIAHDLNVADKISADLESRLSKLAKRAKQRGSNPKVLYLARSGGSAGKGTFVDAAIIAAGGINVLELNGWLSPDPEHILGLEPDLIVTSYFKDGYESVNAAALRHKTLRSYINQFPRIEIDGALWPCAGPRLIEAAERIADALDSLP